MNNLCANCEHLTVCRYKEEYMLYQNKVKEVERPKFTGLEITCQFYTRPVSYTKEGI